MEFNATLMGEMIAFAILIWFCVQFIWPHINKAIEERQQKIAAGLHAAEQAHAELKDADVKVAAQIQHARQQSAEIIDRAQQQAEQILQKARTDAVTEAERQKARAQEDITAMIGQAREELRQRLGMLVVQGASKIVQREIDPSVHKVLLDQLAAEI